MINEIINFFKIVILILIVQCITARPILAFTQLSKTQLLPPIGTGKSQYSPFMMHYSGWGSYLMYYCKMVPVNGLMQDRVYRIEHWNGGLDNAWTGDTMVIQGDRNGDDGLSCSPGIVIDGAGSWHMYYVTAPIASPMTLYLYHATSVSPGITWKKMGKVGGQFPQPVPDYIETPSPILMKDTSITLYFVGGNGDLFRTNSPDGHNFTVPQKMNSPGGAQAGRVSLYNNVYYYIYSVNHESRYNPPNHLLVSTSIDGVNFSPGQLLFSTDGRDWDGTYAWSPHLLVDTNNSWRIYYAGNLGTYDWWGQNSAIGVRVFSSLNITPTATVIPTSVQVTSTMSAIKPGDANNDNRVDGLDYVIWINHFGNDTQLGSTNGDFNLDGRVDGIDYVTWLVNYGH